MDRRSVNAGPAQMPHNAVSAMFGAREHQRTFVGFFLQTDIQQRLLFRLVDENDPLFNAFRGACCWRNSDARGISQKLLRQISN